MNNYKLKCKDRVIEHWHNRREDLQEFRTAGPETDFTNSEGYELYEYALCFDYVDQQGKSPGYWRYQISTGGPQEEIRYYTGKDVPSEQIILLMMGQRQVQALNSLAHTITKVRLMIQKLIHRFS